MAITYILYSVELDKFYIGSTSMSLEERIKRHLSDHKGFTGKAKDLQLVYKEELPDKKSAHFREKQIKSWKSRVRIEDLIKRSS